MQQPQKLNSWVQSARSLLWNGTIWNWVVTELLNKISKFVFLNKMCLHDSVPKTWWINEIAAGNPTKPFQGPLAHAIGGGWPFSASIRKETWLTPLMFTINLVNMVYEAMLAKMQWNKRLANHSQYDYVRMVHNAHVVFLVPPCISRQFAIICGHKPASNTDGLLFLVQANLFLNEVFPYSRASENRPERNIRKLGGSWRFIHSFIHSFILSFIHSFIHSFIQLILNPSTGCKLKQSSLRMDSWICCASSDVISTVLFLGNFHSWGPRCMGPVSLASDRKDGEC